METCQDFLFTQASGGRQRSAPIMAPSLASGKRFAPSHIPLRDGGSKGNVRGEIAPYRCTGAKERSGRGFHHPKCCHYQKQLLPRPCQKQTFAHLLQGRLARRARRLSPTADPSGWGPVGGETGAEVLRHPSERVANRPRSLRRDAKSDSFAQPPTPLEHHSPAVPWHSHEMSTAKTKVPTKTQNAMRHRSTRENRERHT
jgi:hypothetical protein